MNRWFLDQTRKGNVYHSHNTTAGAVTVLHATCTGLVLENPYGSGKDLVVESMSFVGSTLTTIREIGIAISPSVSTVVSATTTAAKSFNGRLNGDTINRPAGLTYSVATLSSTPVWFCPIGNARDTGAVEGAEAFRKSFDGTLIVTPGMFVAFSTLTAAATGLCSITWAEVDELNEEETFLL